MAQAVWTGDIAFGLIQIPVKLYSAQRRTGLSFRMLDSRDAARVRFERVNDDTGEEVPWDQIVKGYEYDGGNYVLLDSADFEAAAEEPTREIEIERFVALDAIEPAYFEKPYYLIANQKKPKSYVLLRETLADTGQAGIAKIVIRGREHLCAIYAEDNALILNMLRFDQELRDLGNFSLPSGPVSDFDISKKEAAMAEELVESMSGE
ncbi:Ku protein [Salinisphaera sp.]|uniref:non-homologous end joining protein Ku n=1 Tax=Salinisphaera sp. TaxID=1914330 RepID=UPI002D783FA6|nr:Ku protein [Salinisphaera sp.]HET7315418.1 Ku protein [Salinisphaera sp.]